MRSIAQSKKAVRVREWSLHQQVKQGCAVLAQEDSAVLAQQESAQLISAMCQIEDMSQKNQTCENTSMLYSKGLLNMRGVAILQHAWCLIISLFQHKDCHTRRAGQCPHHHMDISNPNPPFETPRTTMLSVAELDDEGDFDGVFTNYGNPSH